MTTVAPPPSAAPAGPGGPDPAEIEVPPGHVKLTIDGLITTAPKGELVIRAAERLGIAIPRFCDHPLLAPVGACRQCLVEVEMGGRPMPKPQASCTQTVADGMVVKTQLSSPVAEKAQRSNLEFLLLNHPLDCPVCDKGGECPLQNQTMANGSAHSRLREPKRVFTKPIAVSSQILLDRERCVLCQRCTRFSEQIAGDQFIDLLERGSMQQIGINSAEPFQSYFSGNTIQICPVGALTSAAYRFRARPFDLVSTDTVCEHCSSGCALRTDHRAGGVTRRLARTDDAVNEDWNCDKGRFGFTYVTEPDRITRPLVRDADGVLQPASWTDAIRVAADGLARARDTGGVGVLTGGRLTVTDAYAYAKFARVALRTNDIDFRARPHTAEEAAFLAQRVAGRGLLYGETPDTDGGAAVTYAGLEKASAVLLVGLEPEEESPILFLRLRKAARTGLPVASVAALASRGLQKLDGVLLAAAPGDEPHVLSGLTTGGEGADSVDHSPDAAQRNRVATLLRTPGAVVLVGERAAEVPGLLTAVGALVDTTGARLAWVPRRAGERGALEAGALGTLLPGGRPVTDPAARAGVETAWGVGIPATPGRDAGAILAAVAAPPDEFDGDFTDAAADTGERGLAGLLIGGVELDDLPDPAAARTAVAAAGFVVSLEVRASAVTALADVVFPVAAPAEKAGAYLDWEARVRPFAAALPQVGGLDDGRVLDTLGVEMDVDLFTQTPAAAAGELGRLGRWTGERPAITRSSHPQTAGSTRSPYGGGFRLASWRMAIDGGRGLDGEPHLAGTAKAVLARLSPADAAALGVGHGDLVTVAGPTGAVTLPLAVTPMVDGVVWLPARIDGLATTERLGLLPGRPGDVLLAVRPAPARTADDHRTEGTR